MALGMQPPLLRSISRTPDTKGLKEGVKDEYGTQHGAGMHCTGRLLINLSKLMHEEVCVCVCACVRACVCVEGGGGGVS